MTQSAKAQEPSMEEILASIRRIIADDDASKTPAKPEPAKAALAPARAAPPPPPAPPRPAAAAAPRPAPPPPRTLVPESPPSLQDDIDSMFEKAEPKVNGAARPASNDILELTEEMEAPPEPMPALRHIDATPDVVYNDSRPVVEPAVTPTVEEARRKFQEQTGADRNLLSANTTAAVDSAFNSLAQTVLVQNSRTLDDLVREMLRPMLKAWLDDNLPNMVERLVRAEIERVSRGRG
jgi:cell pole-organizing protein PopZ